MSKIELIHGDCLAEMQKIPEKSIDTVITDLPYGIDYQSSWRTDKNKRFSKIANDKKPFIDFIKYIPRILKDTGCVYLFTRWDVQQPVIDELEENGMPVKNVLIWDKCNHSMGDLKTSYGSRYESIVFSSTKNFRFQNGRPVDIISCPRVSADKLVHPNEKPVNLLRRLILDSTPTDGLVLDCTAGSGTTLIAAINEKRNCIGIELDDKYFAIAEKRIKEAQQQLLLDL